MVAGVIVAADDALVAGAGGAVLAATVAATGNTVKLRWDSVLGAKSFSIYAWDAAGAAVAVSRRVLYFAVIQ